MPFYPVERNANAASKVLSLKSSLVSALVESRQIQLESAEMTEIQIQTHYGFGGTQAEWLVTIDGVVTALEAAAIENYISQLG
ncbi:hypothetical protein KAR91_64805 [Candidatus Pacearchaeota archaeon]|nr:hypothetical protein [Candidatus Pacearchaeota archaeon]